MKKEIKLFENLEIIVIVMAFYFLFTSNRYDILIIRCSNCFGTYNQYKPIGVCMFAMCQLFRYYLKRKREILQKEIDIYEKFLND